MITYYFEDLLTLASLLHCAISPDRPFPEIADWHGVIAAAGDHLVTPMLGLLPEDRLPAEVFDYAQAALFLNGERNRVLQTALADIIAALAAEGIRAVALKGAAALAEGLYPHPGARVLGDLDLLVAAGRQRDAFAVLQSRGWTELRTAEAERWVRRRQHHMPALCHPDSGAGVDLHHHIAKPGDPPWLQPEAALDRAAAVARHPRRIEALSPTDRIIHCLLHDQISDRLDMYNRLRLRTLVELALLTRHHGEAIDWREVDNAVTAGRFKNAVRWPCNVAAALFAAPIGLAEPGQAAASIARWKQGFEQRPPDLAIEFYSFWLKARAQPSVLLNLLDPRDWQRRWQRAVGQK